MAKIDLSSPALFINRELSWLEFNHRVLAEGLRPEVPLFERLRFLAIVSSNLDEFFMVRVAGLMQQRSAGVRRRDQSGLTPTQQLTEISKRAHRMVAEQAAGIRQAIRELAGSGLRVLEPQQWTAEQRHFLRSHFAGEILPVLTPLAVEELSPVPLLPSGRLHLALLVTYAPGSSSPAASQKIIVVPVPASFNRFIPIPAADGIEVARLEAIIAENIGLLFPGGAVVAVATFRITRDADPAIDEDDANDLLQALEHAVLERRRRAAVRLELSPEPEPRLKSWLMDWLQLRAEEVYEGDAMLDPTGLFELQNRQGFAALRAPEWPPQPPQDLPAEGSLLQAVQSRDVLLVHPYESFDPLLLLLAEAAVDPNVLAIKMVLYRLSGDSPIISALETAAAQGKQVTVLVEVKARFDEAQNIRWARRLEDAGCHVVYGIAGLKTHAKAMLIVMRDGARIRRAVHLSTGNYNDKTARLYSDVGLLTADRDLCGDVASFFNLLTGTSEAVGWSALVIAPTDLRRRLLELIGREAESATAGQPGLILAKLNSLEDKEICQALLRAAQAGVKVQLNVRGICCLRPGVKKISEGIEVRSIVDRYLEHARILYFKNGGHDELYLSSADWMGRNLDRRLELLFPVRAAPLRRRLLAVLETYFADNQQAWRLGEDGTYARVPATGAPIRAQQKLYEDAVRAATLGKQTAVRFKPLAAPEGQGPR
ncbi:MAG: polyphosphate kinase 1 [Deltaproteobacteria bacterium]|nr:polyphosphate kinase 1 [Deltaproteobacteria bacterium]